VANEFRITVSPGVGVHAGWWQWYLDGPEGQLASGLEDEIVEAAVVACSALAHFQLELGVNRAVHFDADLDGTRVQLSLRRPPEGKVKQ
jgi:hypothetical protein